MISITVPEHTTSRYVVVTDHPPAEPAALVPWQVARPFARDAAERLGTPELRIETRQAGGGAHEVHVSGTVPVTGQPYGAQVIRAVARAIAGFTSGTLVDPLTGRTLPGGEREDAAFRPGDHWVGVESRRGGPPCAVPEPADDDADVCRCVRLTTCGLARFGLPELHMDQVACALGVMGLNMLRAVAARMLADHWSWLATGPADPTRAIPGRLVLGAGDYGRYWGCACACGDSSAVHLTGAGPGMIAVGPPPEVGGTTNDWIWAVTPPRVFDVLSCDGETVRPVPADAEPESLRELSAAERGRLLGELLVLRPDVAGTADDLAAGWLAAADRNVVAGEVTGALSDADLRGAPVAAAASWSLRRALRPFYRDLERRSRLGRIDAAAEVAAGMLRALREAGDHGPGGPLGDAPDLADEEIGELLRRCATLPIHLPPGELDRALRTRTHGIRRAC